MINILRILLNVGFVIMAMLMVRLKSEIIVINGRYRGSAHISINIDININIKLNHKIPIVFHHLKNYDPHIIMQELGKFYFKINVIPNRLEKYMSFNINDELRFIHSFQFPSSSLVSLVKNVGKVDFIYLSQEFDNKVLDLVKHKGCYPLCVCEWFEKDC